MKKSIGILAIGFVLAIGVSSNLQAACGSVDNSLRLVLPCIEYAGHRYEVVFDYYPNPADPANLYWRYFTLRPSTSSGSCGSADAGLNITGACVNFLGTQYRFNLVYAPIPGAPSGLYWKLATLVPLPGSIETVSGDDSICYQQMDFTQYAQVAQCMIGCADDPTCISGCLGVLGLSSVFSLGLTLDNPTGSAIEYTLPAGFRFSPSSSGVQPMLVLQTLTLTVAPGPHQYCVPTYCLDSLLDAPGESDVYTAELASSQQCVRDIITYTEGKSLNGSTSMRVQDIIWSCMEGGSISAEDRAFLEGL